MASPCILSGEKSQGVQPEPPLQGQNVSGSQPIGQKQQGPYRVGRWCAANIDMQFRVDLEQGLRKKSTHVPIDFSISVGSG